jgi:hypothetical protein
MNPRRCVCGHHSALHWQYGRMQGCSHPAGCESPCRCGGYAPAPGPVGRALGELLDCVEDCERDWALMDRIDLALGYRPQPGA